MTARPAMDPLPTRSVQSARDRGCGKHTRPEQVALGLPATEGAASGSEPVEREQRAGLPHGRRLRQLRCAVALAVDPGRDDVVHQLVRVQRVRLRQRGAQPPGGDA
jgi:hypothetical protein